MIAKTFRRGAAHLSGQSAQMIALGIVPVFANHKSQMSALDRAVHFHRRAGVDLIGQWLPVGMFFKRR